MRIGLAGWSNPPAHKALRRASQTHLEYYAECFSCVEINSSFHRPHKRATYAAWRVATPAQFKFSVKMPRTITHDSGLVHTKVELMQFYTAIDALLPKLGAVLMQLPPSLEFDPRSVRAFLKSIPRWKEVRLVCEPRHASWFTPAADALLVRSEVAASPQIPLRSSAPTNPAAVESAPIFAGTAARENTIRVIPTSRLGTSRSKSLRSMALTHGASSTILRALPRGRMRCVSRLTAAD